MFTTVNIYKSWHTTVGEIKDKQLWVKQLGEFTPEELNHLVWLLTEEIKSRIIKSEENHN